MGLLLLTLSFAFAQSPCSLPEGQSYNVFVKSAAHEASDIRVQDSSNSFFVRHYIDKDGVMGLRIAVMGLLKMDNDDFHSGEGKRAKAYLRSRLSILARKYDVSEVRNSIDDRSGLKDATERLLAKVARAAIDVRDSDQDDEKTKKLDALKENLPYTTSTCKTVLNSFDVDNAYGLKPETHSFEQVVTISH